MIAANFMPVGPFHLPSGMKYVYSLPVFGYFLMRSQIIVNGLGNLTFMPLIAMNTHADRYNRLVQKVQSFK